MDEMDGYQVGSKLIVNYTYSYEYGWISTYLLNIVEISFVSGRYKPNQQSTYALTVSTTIYERAPMRYDRVGIAGEDP